MAVVAGDEVGNGDSFFLALVREHRAAHAVADRPHALGARLAVIVDLDEAAAVERDAGALGQQVLGEWPPPDGDDHSIDDERLVAGCVRVGDVHAVLFDLRAGNLGAEPDVEALLLEMPQRFLRDRAVGHRQELLERLEHDRLGTEPAPHAAQLEPDDARPDDAEALRNRVELECSP